MWKRSRMLKSSSLGTISPLDEIFCREPADAWEEIFFPTPPPPPPRANPVVTYRPPPPHVETDLEVVEVPTPTPKTMIASPKALIPSEVGKEAPERSPTSPMIFSVEASSTEDFVPEKPGEFFKSCFLCKKEIRANQPVYMFGYMRAFCSSFCRAEQMNEEGIVLTSTKLNEVSPTYVDKKSRSTRSQCSRRHEKGSAF